MSCVADMKKWARKNGYEKPGFCSINMASIAANCKGGLMKSMLKKMAKELGVDAETAKLPTYEKKLEKKVFVLVLDEIDMLFKTHGGIGETWFRTLVEWAENKELRFSMIGISNCVNDVNATRVREMGHVSLDIFLRTSVITPCCAHIFLNFHSLHASWSSRHTKKKTLLPSWRSAWARTSSTPKRSS